MARVIRAQRTGAAIVRAHHAGAAAPSSQPPAASPPAELTSLGASALAAGNAEAARQLLAVARLRERALSDVQHEGLRAVLLVAAALLGETIEAEPQRIVGMLGAQLTRVRRAQWLVLQVHPDDAAWLEAHPGALCERAEFAGQLELRADPSIARGGCLLTSNLGELDARIETRLAELGHALGLPADNPD